MVKNLLPITMILLLSLIAWFFPSDKVHAQIPALEVLGKVCSVLAFFLFFVLVLLHLFFTSQKK